MLKEIDVIEETMNGNTKRLFNKWKEWMELREDSYYRRLSEKAFSETVLKVSTASFYKTRKNIRDNQELYDAWLEAKSKV